MTLALSIRAAAIDQDAARLMGIDVNRIIAATFLLGSLLAGTGGVLWAMKYPQVNPFMGILPGRPQVFPGQNAINLTVLGAALAILAVLVAKPDQVVLFNCASGLKYPLPKIERKLDRHKPIDYASL